jgi:hypothetical protein
MTKKQSKLPSPNHQLLVLNLMLTANFSLNSSINHKPQCEKKFKEEI